mgnify:CR=1 FL=1
MVQENTRWLRFDYVRVTGDGILSVYFFPAQTAP